MRTEFGTRVIQTDVSALDRVRARQTLDKLGQRMLYIAKVLPSRTDRHHGYLVRQKMHHDVVIDLVNRRTTLNVQLFSVRRLRRDTVIVTVSCSMGGVNFFVKGARR